MYPRATFIVLSPYASHARCTCRSGVIIIIIIIIIIIHMSKPLRPKVPNPEPWEMKRGLTLVS
jgi:hypothetical protein